MGILRLAHSPMASLLPTDRSTTYFLTSPYFFRTGLPYSDYLKVYHIEDAIRTNLGTSDETLSQTFRSGAIDIHAEQKKIAALTEASLGVSLNLLESSHRIEVALSEGFKGTISALEGIESSIEAGFALTHEQLRKVNASLSELIAIQKNPTSTWACEQFSIARTLYEKGFDSDALSHLNFAISGADGHTGYPLEYRFYTTKGIVLLGRPKMDDFSLVDLEAAESCFIRAARLAASDDARECARNYSLAAHAAQCRGALQNAKEYIERALQLAPSDLEIRFANLRIIAIVSGEFQSQLARALFRDCASYALRAGTDGAFLKHQNSLTRSIQEDADQRRCALRANADGCLRTLAESASLLQALDLRVIHSRIESLSKLMDRNALPLGRVLDGTSELQQEIDSVVNLLSKEIRRKKQQIESAKILLPPLKESLRYREINIAKVSDTAPLGVFFGLFSGPILGLYGCTMTWGETSSLVAGMIAFGGYGVLGVILAILALILLGWCTNCLQAPKIERIKSEISEISNEISDHEEAIAQIQLITKMLFNFASPNSSSHAQRAM